MKKIIFSKQSDVDSDIAPFWNRWYREVFKADLIVITPVKTKLSSVKKTLAYYKKLKTPCHVITLDTWDDQIIWQKQLKIMREFVPSNEPFICLSADSDQYFEPPRHPRPKCVYQRINLISGQTPHEEFDLEAKELEAHAGLDLIGGFTNTLDDPDVWDTGHFRGTVAAMPRTDILREFHLTDRGFEHFKVKISGIAIVDDGKPRADGWKKWRRIFDSGDEGALLAAYQEYQKDIKGDPIDPSLSELFCSYARGDAVQSPHTYGTQTRFQYPSALLPARIGSDAHSFGMYVPSAEFETVKTISEWSKYAFPKSLRTDSSPVVVDVGAGLGFFALGVKASFPSAKVWCIEPATSNITLLKNNLREASDTQILSSAIGSEVGYQPLYLDSQTTEGHTLLPHSAWATETVSVMRGDMLWNVSLRGPIDLLKINCSGGEFDVLESFGSVLSDVQCVSIAFSTYQELDLMHGLLREFTLTDSRGPGGGIGTAQFVRKS